MLHTFIKHMEENGWQVALYENRNDYLSNIITARYTNIPEQWLEFIKTVKCMMNAEETVWFLCANDFETQSDGAFQWNEWGGKRSALHLPLAIPSGKPGSKLSGKTTFPSSCP